jgi:hypothetical protein
MVYIITVIIIIIFLSRTYYLKIYVCVKSAGHNLKDSHFRQVSHC